MKTLVITLVVILISTSAISALQCYSCTGCQVGDTSTITNCTGSGDVCGKSTVTIAGQTVVPTKGCVSVCTPLSTGDANQGASTTCCSTDLCNAAYTQQASSFTALALHLVSAVFGRIMFGHRL